MAKLTLSFDGRLLKSLDLSADSMVIGRNPNCELHIGSLSIEPRHARIYRQKDQYLIEPIDETGKVQINAETITKATHLKEGDSIQIGKHALRFSHESIATDSDERNANDLPNASWLQIQSGNHVGRTIRLNKAFTRIGRPDGELAIIACRDDGYFLSHLHGEQRPLLNGQAIGDQACTLGDGDRIQIGTLTVQFFAGTTSVEQARLLIIEQDSQHQRNFSRIAFDVDATIKDPQQSWQTRLIDISLHGALIETPDNFSPAKDQLLQLSVHLDGGPDICMEVKIMHQEQHQAGLRCEDIDVSSITHLRRLLELNLDDPELLERELSALG